MACNKRNPFWFDTWTLAAATAFPAEVQLFNATSTTKGPHLTNNPGAGQLPTGHQLTVKGLAVTPIEMAAADLNYIAKNMYFEVLRDQTVIHDGKIVHYPQQGGLTSDGAAGVLSNGTPGYHSVGWLDPADQFTFGAQESYMVRLVNKGAAQNSAAGAGVHLLFTFFVDWMKP